MKRLSEVIPTICCFHCKAPYKKAEQITIQEQAVELVFKCDGCGQVDAIRSSKQDLLSLEAPVENS